MVALFPAHDHKPTMRFTLSKKAPQLKLTLLEPPERETLLHLTVRADFFKIVAIFFWNLQKPLLAIFARLRDVSKR